MESKAFIDSVQQKLHHISPVVLPDIIDVQLRAVGARWGQELDPETAEKFVKRMEEALLMFLGPSGSKRAHQMMMDELRKHAPDHFEENSSV